MFAANKNKQHILLEWVEPLARNKTDLICMELIGLEH
jgi:hypothetical protein